MLINTRQNSQFLDDCQFLTQMCIVQLVHFRITFDMLTFIVYHFLTFATTSIDSKQATHTSTTHKIKSIT